MSLNRSVLRAFLASVALFTAAACTPAAMTSNAGDETEKERDESDDDDDDDNADHESGDDDDDAVDPKGGDSEPTAPDANKLESVLVVDLGDVKSGASVVLDVPRNVLGFNVAVSSQGAGKVGVQKIESPKGTVLLDDFTVKGASFPVGEGTDGMASVGIPQNDMPEATTVSPGKWKITFSGAGSNAHATARLQTTKDGKFHGGVLDLHIHIPKGLTIGTSPRLVTAKGAPNDPDLGERVDVFFDALERSFGITRGDVRFHEAPAKFLALNDDATIVEAGAVAKGMPESHALHLLLTNDILSGDLSGLSPGIPGAVTTTGTARSAIFAAFYSDHSDATVDGITWLHEMGHFVGLNHTSEFSGTLFDPLSDTPKCTDPNASCADHGNLMATGNIVPAKTTAGQKRVVRGSPIFNANSGAAFKSNAFISSGVDTARTVWSPLGTNAERHAQPLVRSGRALKPVERWLQGTFCGSSSQSPRAWVGARGKAQARVDLEEVAHDDALPLRFRTKAERMLARIAQEP